MKKQKKLPVLLFLLVTLGGFIPPAFAGIGGFFQQMKDIADDVRETTKDGVEIFKNVDRMADVVEGDKKPKTQPEQTQEETDCDVEIDCPSNSK